MNDMVNIHCPHCNAKIAIINIDTFLNRTVDCTNCGRKYTFTKEFIEYAKLPWYRKLWKNICHKFSKKH